MRAPVVGATAWDAEAQPSAFPLSDCRLLIESTRPDSIRERTLSPKETHDPTFRAAKCFTWVKAAPARRLSVHPFRVSNHGSPLGQEQRIYGLIMRYITVYLFKRGAMTSSPGQTE